MFYMVFENLEKRTAFMNYLKENGICAVFHYLSLHKSDYFKNQHDGRELPQSDRYTDCLVRLPLFYDLKDEDQTYIIDKIKAYYGV